jgi:pimeloyl-ACP methyl ester carboxylesterase
MSGILAAQGHTAVAQPGDADVVIVNTCSFIAAARDETLGVLRELASGKAPGQRLVAAGCMAESHGAIVGAVPGVDAILSTREWMKISDLVATGNGVQGIGQKKAAGWQDLIPLTVATPTVPPSPVSHSPSPNLSVPGDYADWRTAPIKRHVQGPSASLKISDGCNLRCAFCTIPSFKGDMRSKAIGAILGEAQQLAAQGVREIVLVAQHLTDYGRDLKLKDGLATLLDELCGVLGIASAAVVGSSMGGLVSAELALRSPQRVERLMLVSAAGLSTETLPIERLLRMLTPLERFVTLPGALAAAHAPALASRRRLRKLMLLMICAHPDRLPAPITAELLMGAGRPGLLPGLRAITAYPIRERLGEIVCPTSIIWGARDRVVPVADASEFHRLIGQARTVIYPDTGHLPMIERPDCFNEDLRAFMAQ